LTDHFETREEDGKKLLDQLRAKVERGDIVAVHSYGPADLTVTHSVGYTTYGLPEIVVYGLSEESADAIFRTMFAQMEKRTVIEMWAPYRMRMIWPENAPRLVPLLQSLFPDRFTLAQFLWPDQNGFYPGQRRFDRSLRERQPRVWEIKRIPTRAIPAKAWSAEWSMSSISYERSQPATTERVNSYASVHAD